MSGDPGGGVVGVIAGDGEGRAVRFLVVGDHLREGEVLEDRVGHWGDD